MSLDNIMDMTDCTLCPRSCRANRAEGEVGLRAFFDRFPDVRSAGAGSRRDTRVLHGWSTLPVALGPARSMATR